MYVTPEQKIFLTSCAYILLWEFAPSCVCTLACVCVSYCCWHPQIPGATVYISMKSIWLSAVWCHTSLTFSLLIWFSNWSHIFTLSLFCCQATWPALNSFGKYFPDVIDIDCKKRMCRCLLSFLFSQFIFHLIYRSMFDMSLLHYC